MIQVKAEGFKEGAGLFRDLSSGGFDRAVEKLLQSYGTRVLEEFRRRAAAGMFLPRKRRGQGPPLIDTGEYVASWTAQAKGPRLLLSAEGMHSSGMSNNALGELLEYGSTTIPQRPHQRMMVVWITSDLPAYLERNLRRVLGSSR